MNYRHAYHAGNFADVMKHAVLAQVMMHLRDKATPFRVIDTHAGAGAYDLNSPEALATGEWQGGIARLLDAELAPDLSAWLSPYLDVVRALNLGELATYPGSPVLAQALLRPHDRLVACELDREAAAELARRLRGDPRVKAIAIDGWTALNAYVPPRERRGLVLIDPPYEEPGEFERLTLALAGAHRKWSIGTFIAWYPIKDRRETDRFGRALGRLPIAKILRAELLLRPPAAEEKLAGAGLIVINPPWRLPDSLKRHLPALAGILGDERGSSRVDWLSGETV